MKDLFERLEEYSEKFPDKPALMTRNDKLTYGELNRLVRGFCGYVKSLGIEKGDFVMCRASVALDYWVAYFGTQLAGGVFVPLEKDASVERFRDVARSLEKVFAVVAASDDERMSRDLASVFITMNEVRSRAARYVSDETYASPDPDSPGQVLFTTGTTGKAKGVVLSHSYITMSGQRNTEIPYGPDIVMILASPTNHVLSVGRCTTLLLHGGAAVFTDGLTDLGEFYDALSLCGANAMTLTPSALNYIIALTGEEFEKYDEQIVFIEIGGEKLPASRQREFMKMFPSVRFFNVYASTEAGEICFYEFSRHGASDVRIGIPVPGVKVRYTDENGREYAATRSDPGFVSLETNCHMSGYWNDEENTRKVLQGDTVIMSDYGYTDEEGFVCLAGRAGSVIISGGHKIDPTEVESAALATGLVNDCVCFGQRDDIFGNVVVLHVVPKDGRLDVAALKAGLSENLEGYKLPQIIVAADAIRRNANGKTDRRYYTELGKGGDHDE